MTISVIIPAVNEGPNVRSAITSAWTAGADEVIVVDGGSRDDTADVARHLGATVVASERGRARQQNAGAAQARGDLLLFLHADSQLASSCLTQLRESAAARSACMFGAFRQRIDAPGWQYRLLEKGNAWRVLRLGLAYGDQGIFVRKSWFEQIGQFPDVPLLEDLMLSQRARRSGITPILLPGPLSTSPRRWQRHGILRQTLRNWTIVAAYFLGVSPTSLRNWYRAHDKST